MSVQKTIIIVTRMASAQTHMELILAIVPLDIVAMDDNAQVIKTFFLLVILLRDGPLEK